MEALTLKKAQQSRWIYAEKVANISLFLVTVSLLCEQSGLGIATTTTLNMKYTLPNYFHSLPASLFIADRFGKVKQPSQHSPKDGRHRKNTWASGGVKLPPNSLWSFLLPTRVRLQQRLSSRNQPICMPSKHMRSPSCIYYYQNKFINTARQERSENFSEHEQLPLSVKQFMAFGEQQELSGRRKKFMLLKIWKACKPKRKCINAMKFRI